MKLGVFSGQCLLGVCGDETDLIDYRGDSLSIGDIVLVSYAEHKGVTHSAYLSVIVNDKYTTYSDDTISENTEFKNFIMGIAKVTKDELAVENEEGELCSGWVIEKVKGFADVVDGEHWKGYGFNYKYLKD